MRFLIVSVLIAISIAIANGQQCTCGRSFIGTRVVGGKEATPNKYPWMATLVTRDGRQFCAGSLINDRYILTAAHCFVNAALTTSTIKVALGAHDLTNRPPLVTDVTDIIKHPQYTGPDTHHLYDIALLRLSSPVNYNQLISPVCLAPESLQSFNNLLLAGWGMTSFKSERSQILLEAQLTEVPIPQCQRTGLGEKRVNRDHVCTFDEYKSPCMGDSGGPLVSNQANYWYQAGVVSWGIKCGDELNGKKYPAVFTRVSSYLNWIKQHTQDANWCANPVPAPSSGTGLSSRGGSGGGGVFGRFFG